MQQRAPEQPRSVSVIVATYGRPDTLVRTLDSLVAQTLSLQDFEVVVIVNGPPGETPAVVGRYREQHPELDLRLLVTEQAGVAHARSLGVLAARGTYMTMIDDDDWVSPAYLQRMLDAIRPGILPLVDIADVVDGGEPSFANSYSERFRRYRGRVVPATTISPAMSFNVCKLIPTVTAREVGFDERLRSASDTLFWLRVYERTRAMLHVLDVDDAVYYRTTETGSLSRQDATYDFSVTRRLDAYASLGEIPDGAPEVANLMLSRTAGSLARHMNAFLREHPDQHAAVEEDVRARGLHNVSWRRANALLAEELVVVGELVEPAFGDPLTSYRSIAERGEVTDVVGVLGWNDQVPWTPGFVHARLGMRDRANMRLTTDPWHRASLLSDRLERITEIREEGGAEPHTRLRSHDPTGRAHAAAARFRLRRPGTAWTVEIAEPPGDPDTGPPCEPDDVLGVALLDELLAGLPPGAASGAAVQLPRLGLELAAALAERITVTSAPLRAALLAVLAGSPSAERAAAITVVDEPAAVPGWGRVRPAHGVDLVPDRVHLVAAVETGAGDASDGLGEALDGLAAAFLDEPAARARLRVHLIGAEPDRLATAAWAVGLGDVVAVHPPLGIDALLSLFDDAGAVLVLDGPAADLCPPAYLPDALASDTPAWVLARPGGLLEQAGAAADWVTRTDDVTGNRAVLEAIATDAR